MAYPAIVYWMVGITRIVGVTARVMSHTSRRRGGKEAPVSTPVTNRNAHRGSLLLHKTSSLLMNIRVPVVHILEMILVMGHISTYLLGFPMYPDLPPKQ